MFTIGIKYLADYPQFIPTIAEWYYHQWGFRKKNSSVEQIKSDLKNYLNQDRIPLMLLVLNGDEIVGVAQLKYREMDIYPEKEHWLGGVYVLQKHRGKGIATQVVKKSIQKADELGITTLYLQTERLDGGIYKDLGWTPIEQVTYYGKEVLVMEKHFDQAKE